MTRKSILTVRIEPGVVEWLKAIARRDNRTASYVARDILSSKMAEETGARGDE